MVEVRRASVSDAGGIGAVHVAAWRSAYPTILPDRFLAGMSASRQRGSYARAIAMGAAVHVAIASAEELRATGLGHDRSLVVGFATAGARAGAIAEGEIETLYVLDDWRDRGLGRRLLIACARGLAEAGCRSAYVWVLRDNPSRWFYSRLGGRIAMDGTVRVAGIDVPQTAIVWNPIESLLARAGQEGPLP